MAPLIGTDPLSFVILYDVFPDREFHFDFFNCRVAWSSYIDEKLRGSKFLRRWMEFLEDNADLRYPDVSSLGFAE